MRIEGAGKFENSKLIRFKADIEDGVIKNISISGDFFASPEEEFEKAEQFLIGVSVKDISSAFDFFIQKEKIEAYGISGTALSKVIFSALEKGEEHE